ncbi:hypothetical protein [Pelosinus sp. sgz500959]|uniref:hypothetical protein n=1 Tax=Pelosinus sp. sgz500959 TaxID=3242472 RepID=UPI003670AEA9
MNMDEIIKMKPGRDLDIKVALEVMDYIWLKHLLQFSAELAVKWLGTPADIEKSSGMYVRVPESQFLGLKEREDFAEAVLPFSTDMVAAEQVLKHMGNMGYECKLETKIEEGNTLYYAYIQKAGMPIDENVVGFTTAPEAIVKAALKNFQLD